MSTCINLRVSRDVVILDRCAVEKISGSEQNLVATSVHLPTFNACETWHLGNLGMDESQRICQQDPKYPKCTFPYENWPAERHNPHATHAPTQVCRMPSSDRVGSKPAKTTESSKVLKPVSDMAEMATTGEHE